MKIKNWLSSSLSKKYLIIGIPIGFISVILVYLVCCWIIFSGVKSITTQATEEFRLTPVQSLIAVIESNKFGFEKKNDAIWALGQIGDKKALPILEQIFTDKIEKHCNRSENICQYEVQKAIKFCRSNFIVTRWMYGGFKS